MLLMMNPEIRNNIVMEMDKVIYHANFAHILKFLQRCCCKQVPCTLRVSKETGEVSPLNMICSVSNSNCVAQY